jgi:trk system potassium uptake protein
MTDNMQNNSVPVEPYHRKPGDHVYRVSRLISQVIQLPPILRPKPMTGVSFLSFVYGFGAMIAAGTLLLVLPVSSHNGQFTSLVTCLFTSTSAVCVTGLVVVDTLDHWSLFGQIVIVFLIQLGGLGFMTSTTIFLMFARRKIGLRGRILIGESIGVSQIGGMVRLARNIVLFTITVEVLGTIVLFLRFLPQYGWATGLWKSIFQAVSAFNNAGFDIFGGFRSITGYSGDYQVMLTTAALIITGGISFVVVNNLFHARSLHRITLDTKVVLLITVILLTAGTLLVLATEYHNPETLGNMPLPLKILNSFFQSVTARTAGFNTINTGALTFYTLFIVMFLMFVGGASGSTAGGIKVNTFALIVITIWNTLRGREHPQAFGRELQVEQILRGITLLGVSLGLVVVVFLILSATESFSPIRVLFETVSAFGTVGLSTGITPDLSITGRLLIILVMFVGRLGPLTLIMALAQPGQPSPYRYPKEPVKIG